MPSFPDTAAKPGEEIAVHERRHVEWRSQQLRFRWLLDSWEGGEAYRNAVYGVDITYGLPIRNLIRHKREFPMPTEPASTTGRYFVRPQGSDQYTNATDDDYTLRLARTPVPTLFPERIEAHLSSIFAREVTRDTPDAKLKAWWDDIDGKGSTIDHWMAETVAPLLMVLGCVDIFCDHPPVPGGLELNSLADEQAMRIDRCVASVILPENMVWWELDDFGKYEECLVCELQDDSTRRYRHWTAEGWTLYRDDGELLDQGTHPFGRVPIERVFDRRRPRHRNVGLPRYEAIAELQREYYNLSSELILSDTTQAHPLLQGPEDYVQADGTVPIGPSWLLPKKKNNQGGSVTYEGFEVVDFPKGAAESIRQNLASLVDRADRAAMLTKPAGAQGTTGNTVSQSGVSKRLDQSGGNNLLAKIAGVLQRAEDVAAGLALLVLGNGRVKPEAVKATTIAYPKSFDLMTAEELAGSIAEFQALVEKAGLCPRTELALIERLVRLMLPGLDDELYAEMDAEIELTLEAAALLLEQRREASPTVPENPEDVTTNGPGNEPPVEPPGRVGPPGPGTGYGPQAPPGATGREPV